MCESKIPTKRPTGLRRSPTSGTLTGAAIKNHRDGSLSATSPVGSVLNLGQLTEVQDTYNSTNGSYSKEYPSGMRIIGHEFNAIISNNGTKISSKKEKTGEALPAYARVITSQGHVFTISAIVDNNNIASAPKCTPENKDGLNNADIVQISAWVKGLEGHSLHYFIREFLPAIQLKINQMIQHNTSGSEEKK